MDKEIITLGKEGYGELTEKKSTFIAYARPVENEEEAAAFVASVRKKYPDARHTAYAYMISSNGITRYSDDGEPQGTAGLPILGIIKNGGFDNAVITVTRYFGGILLGTGGLVRAYSGAAKEAVADAGLVCYRRYSRILLEMTYGDYSKCGNILSDEQIITESSDFGDTVRLTVSIPAENSAGFAGKITELTAGRCLPAEIGEGYYPHKV